MVGSGSKNPDDARNTAGVRLNLREQAEHERVYL
jgi:hypothetical protein